MLQITIPGRPSAELWDERNEVFITLPAVKEQTLQLEHSLVSLKKWESKWCKPFLSKADRTDEESIDYIRCMTITQNVPPEVYDNITDDIIVQVTDYINAPMTATWFTENASGKKGSSEVVTAELIYYWMIALQIPPEYQKWHLNQLMTLIRVCNEKNKPPKKMSTKSIFSRNRSLNAARRKQYNSKG